MELSEAVSQPLNRWLCICQYGRSAIYLGTAQMAAANEEQTAHANLIWNPTSFVALGVEWTWGRRMVAAVAAGLPRSNNLNALIGKFDVSFLSPSRATSRC